MIRLLPVLLLMGCAAQLQVVETETSCTVSGALVAAPRAEIPDPSVCTEISYAGVNCMVMVTSANCP